VSAPNTRWKRIRASIPISEIQVRGKVPFYTNREVITFAGKMLYHGVEFPPVRVHFLNSREQALYPGKRFVLTNGRHRLRAHQLLNHKFIMAKFAIPI
jgi:hypothetical protein